MKTQPVILALPLLFLCLAGCSPGTGQQPGSSTEDSTGVATPDELVPGNTAADTEEPESSDAEETVFAPADPLFGEFIAWCPEYTEGREALEIPEKYYGLLFRKAFMDLPEDSSELFSLFLPTISGKFHEYGHWAVLFSYNAGEMSHDQLHVFSEDGAIIGSYRLTSSHAYANTRWPHDEYVSVLENAIFRITTTEVTSNWLSEEDMVGLYLDFSVDRVTNSYKTIDGSGRLVDDREPVTKENIRVRSALSEVEFSEEEILSEIETAGELKLKRNEVLAVHGCRFKSQDLKEYFGKQPWYRPRYDDVSGMLSEIEKKNIRTLLKLEQEMD